MKLIDLHCDTAMKLLRDPEVSLARNDFSIDLEKLDKVHSLAQVFALYVDKEKYSSCLQTGRDMLARLKGELEKNADQIAWAGNGAAIRANEKSGKKTALIAIEEGGVLEGTMESLHEFFEGGVRFITLTWNYPNEIGFPHGEEHGHKGLTPFGIELLGEMDRLGVIADVSHLSEGGFWDVVKHCKGAFMATHSNCRALKGHSRNLHDEQIKALADKGGVMGISVVKNFLMEGDDDGRLDAMVAHIKHAHKIGGLDVLAMGTDFDGTATNHELQYIDDLNKLEPKLREAGYTEDQLEKIYWRNALRVIDEVLR
ncbi:membrane dipeptidase [Desulfovibrio sp. OttesenSCG-928-I05]|nr:membrane dipeptidase [Desulfovibrio sp. OttesenSCG-928-I05]